MSAADQHYEARKLALEIAARTFPSGNSSSVVEAAERFRAFLEGDQPPAAPPKTEASAT
jgi:hypothetical protein